MDEQEFEERLERHHATCTDLWGSAPIDLAWGPVIPLKDKVRREAQAERWIDHFERMLRRYPRVTAQQETWKGELLCTARQMASVCLGFNREGVNMLFIQSALQATDQFIRQAKAFDGNLADEDLLQALRNLWVLHALQLLLDEPPSLSPAGFAYSMLYPCTDNCLDDPAYSPERKRRLGRWLECRLAGERALAPDFRAGQIDRLITMIEGCYPRMTFPEVYLSLRAIHRAQLCSLEQQCPLHVQDSVTLLRITLAKGGSSVLTDGYLVNGRLGEAETEFAFAYGVLLQLMDDLQDFEIDAANGHSTLVTQAVASDRLETIIARFWAFTQAVLRNPRWFAAPRFSSLKSLIEDNCRLFVLHLVARNQRRLSQQFVRDLETISPFRFSYLATRQDSLAGQYKRMVSALRRATKKSLRKPNDHYEEAACVM